MQRRNIEDLTPVSKVEELESALAELPVTGAETRSWDFLALAEKVGASTSAEGFFLAGAPVQEKTGFLRLGGLDHVNVRPGRGPVDERATLVWRNP